MTSGSATIPEMRRIRRIHFVGIGGAGMSGIAEVLLHQGYEISGSDLISTPVTERLSGLGIKIHDGHDAAHVTAADVVVMSSAVPDTNVELVGARDRRIPVVRRAEMLAELMRFRHGIAVAGTHGKTTTTSMIASLLAEGGLDPTFIIGGVLASTETNSKLGASRYMVVEADESDASFLHLQPIVSVLTNIDRDHLVNYEGEFEKLKQAFVQFVHNLPFYGLVVTCHEDATIRQLAPSLQRAMTTYGFHEHADVRATNLRQDGAVTRFDVERRGGHKDLQLRLGMPGRHNVLNALAAVAVATEEGLSDEDITEGIRAFQGVGRRFESHGAYEWQDGEIMLFDDYGHHPAEVMATVAAVREGWPDRRLVMVFQPHRFTRTYELYEDFVEVLAKVDMLVLLDVYAAGESEISGANSRNLCSSIRQRSVIDPIHVRSIDGVLEVLERVIRPNDLVVTQGAGDTSRLAGTLSRHWAARRVV